MAKKKKKSSKRKLKPRKGRKARKGAKNPNLWGELYKRHEAPWGSLVRPSPDGYDDIILANLRKFTPANARYADFEDGRVSPYTAAQAASLAPTRINPDSYGLRQAYIAAKRAALDGDRRARLALPELERLLAEEGQERMRILRNREAAKLRAGKKNPRRKKHGKYGGFA